VADPHLLYLIIGGDILALVLWVAYVLVRMPVATPYVPAGPRAKLPSYSEIQDAPSADAEGKTSEDDAKS
jgi:hypothetical protein